LPASPGKPNWFVTGAMAEPSKELAEVAIIA
jgi:hypothetical protein